MSSHNNNNYLRPTVLWHFMELGTATVANLACASGLTVESIQRKAQELRDEGLVVRNGLTLSLTREGIECALSIDEERVEHAIEAVRHGHVAA